MTSHTHHLAYKLTLLAGLLVSSPVFADEQTYVREYIYQASEADSKISARTIALQEVKRELLNELGTHITALVKIQSASDGTQLGKEEIETLSAGVTSVEILEEKWNGVVYVLKAQIKADPEEVLKNLHKMLDADKKQKQISQLDGELSKVQTEKIQIAESLTQSKKETTAALAEIARLKKQLEEKQTEASRQKLQTSYQEQIKLLTLNELFDSGLKSFQEGNFSDALRFWQKAAEQGDEGAQYNLGWMYYNGKEVAHDAKQAAYWYQKAAAQGHADAQFHLGHLYNSGYGVVRDPKQAVYWYQKAAEQGHADAQFYLGESYAKGEGVARDLKQTAYWYQKAAEQGDLLAQIFLGQMYSKGKGVALDAKQAVYWYQKAAEQGATKWQFILGHMYYKGEGVALDAKQAFYWWQKAAEQGDVIDTKQEAYWEEQWIAKAQYNLGVMYGNGEGVVRDTKQVVYWRQKAAERGYADAQFGLGESYAKGEGVASDAEQSAHWYQKAAEQGHANAQFRLGVQYHLGHGVAHDVTQAMYWYQKAAEQGDADAQFRLGMLYNNAIHDPKQAVYWYQKAAEQGHADAQFYLGGSYARGEGVAQDYVRAHMWYILGAYSISDYSSLVLANEKRLTLKQITQAKKMARDCQQRKYKHCS